MYIKHFYRSNIEMVELEQDTSTTLGTVDYKLTKLQILEYPYQYLQKYETTVV